MNPSEQTEQVERTESKDSGESSDLSNSLWQEMKQCASDAKNIVSGMLPDDQVLDFSKDDIFGNGDFVSKVLQQSGPMPGGEVQPDAGKAQVPTGEVQPDAGKAQVPTGEVQPDAGKAQVPAGEMQPSDKLDPSEAANAVDAQAKTFNPDDYPQVTLGDGTRITNHPDGTVTVKGPDGTYVQYNPDGSKFSKFPDGSSVMEDSEGNKWITSPDGKMRSEHVSFIGKLWDLIPSF